jgi:hypothetical protein
MLASMVAGVIISFLTGMNVFKKIERGFADIV